MDAKAVGVGCDWLVVYFKVPFCLPLFNPSSLDLSCLLVISDTFLIMDLFYFLQGYIISSIAPLLLPMELTLRAPSPKPTGSVPELLPSPEPDLFILPSFRLCLQLQTQVSLLSATSLDRLKINCHGAG